MNPEAQRIAIAEACGFKGITCGPFGQCYSGVDAIPDYPSDLNAMHEAEKVLPDVDDRLSAPDKREYRIQLGIICACPISATAAQRAEAFLRTIGKWEESP